MTPVADLRTVKTYRYLRLAMAVLIVLLLASVVHERLRASTRCFETSISAYYYTPAQGVFVATLVALGVCMVVIKGAGDAEDVLLNLGGMLAVVVGFVPTSGGATCTATRTSAAGVADQVDTSVVSLLVAGVVGLVVTVAVALRQGDLGRDTLAERRNLVGVLVALAVVAAGVVWFVGWHDGFVAHAHEVAATGLFASIIAVVAINAHECRRRQDRDEPASAAPAQRYLVILVLIVVLGLGLVASQWFGFDHWLLVAEATVIGLFAVFWLIQTDELWNAGPRPRRRTDPVGSPT